MNSRILLLLCVACADLSPRGNDEQAPMAPPPEAMELGVAAPSGGVAEEGYGLGGGGRGMGAKSAPAEDRAASRSMALEMFPGDGAAGMDEKKAGKSEAEAPAPTRSWFPESFLWLPVVQTDVSGSTTVNFPVPDSLTTWRVLGLGWTKDGAQGGAELSVRSTLPAYVDVVVPGSLYAGDRVQLPVQVMNTTGEAISGALDVSVSGAVGSGHGSLRVPAGGSATQTVSVTAERSGIATVHAQFGSIDTVERTVPVRPTGRPVDETGAGAVGGAVVEVPAGTPGGDADVQITVWSGAASVVRDEIVGGPMPMEDFRMPSPGVDESAYRFALALAGAKLDKADVDPDALRTLRIRSWLPITRAGRVPDTRTACLLAEALRDAPEGTLERDLRDRMVEQVRRDQAPDGTWIVGASTIDGTLAATASCARAAGEDEAVRLRAEGAFARNVARLEDPYLAAWGLASGALSDEELVARLTTTVTGALVRDNNGAHLPAGGALRADGQPVSDAEATAVAALALASHHDDATALATGLLALRHPWGGWGGGTTNLLALRALSEVFSLDTPKATAVDLLLDGAVVGHGMVATEGAHAPVTLRVPWSGAAAKLEVRAAAAAPGLVFTWRARSYAEWIGESGGPAEVVVTAPANTRVGQVAQVGVKVVLPTGDRGELRIGLPAGVHPDPAGMDTLVSQVGFSEWDSAEGYVELRGVPDGGWEGVIPVIPALGGQLSSGPTRLYVRDEAVAVAVPSRWSIGQ